MADQGRSSSNKAIVVATIALVFLLLQLKATQAATFTVGDDSGWTFNVQTWADGKCFKAGDILTFNYDSSLHNVAVVDVSGYNSCSASPSSKTYTTGKDRIRLKKGQNYFICSIPGHCDGGLKIAICAS